MIDVFFLDRCVFQQGGEAVDRSGFDSDFSEAEGCIEGSLQEQEVFATWSPP